MSQKTALVVGTFDTKPEELNYIVDVLSASGVTTSPQISPPVTLKAQMQFLPVTEAHL